MQPVVSAHWFDEVCWLKYLRGSRWRKSHNIWCTVQTLQHLNPQHTPQLALLYSTVELFFIFIMIIIIRIVVNSGISRISWFFFFAFKRRLLRSKLHSSISFHRGTQALETIKLLLWSRVWSFKVIVNQKVSKCGRWTLPCQMFRV